MSAAPTDWGKLLQIGLRSGLSPSAFWQLSPEAKWHGFPDMEAGFAMTDPKVRELFQFMGDPVPEVQRSG